MKKKTLYWGLILVFFMAGCKSSTTAAANAPIKASGTITADTVQVASEISGKILEIAVAEGGTVKAGDLLFRLDDKLLKAQSDQAQAAVDVAQANLDLAQQKLVAAQTQLDLASQAARLQDVQSHTNNWRAVLPDKITLPSWYYTKEELISALQSQVSVIQTKLDDANSKLQTESNNASNQDFLSAERKLDQAQQAYLVADRTRTEARSAQSTVHLLDTAQTELDNASSDLDQAQKDYDNLLSSDAATRVLDARAQVAIMTETLNHTLDALDKLLTGSDSLQVTLAQSNLDQAKTAVILAEAALTQSQAALQLAQIQLGKMEVVSPVSGVVLTRVLNVGEMAAAGATIVEVGSLDKVTLAVYIPESEYGRIQLNQKAQIQVDSFPGTIFEGTATFISAQAEFTPRNVQTVESRSTTVYKVEITLPNPDLKLKPGMPADATLLFQ